MNTPETQSAGSLHPAGSDIWRDAAEKPAIGDVVENQDGSLVMWCGVNWWHATLWRTMTVTQWRDFPNAADQQPRMEDS